MDTSNGATEIRDRTVTRGLLVALLLVLVICGPGSLLFFDIWAKGDEKAQAFAGLLTFIAASLSAAVTILYVSLTYSSLRRAQESVNLQQEQLKQMKSSFELQRTEWEQKVRVHPQFWVATEGERQWGIPHPEHPGTNKVLLLTFGKQLKINVWNCSEQSFLVESVRLQRSDQAMVPNQQMSDLQVVVTPHSVSMIDVSVEIMRLLTQTSLHQPTPNMMSNDLDKKSRIYVRLVYTDWSKDLAETDLREFEITYRPYDTDVRISKALPPSDVRPSI